MGEKALTPQQNGICSKNENSDGEMEIENEDNDELNGVITPEEFQVIDNQLNALNSALDDIEQKNDNIQIQLLQLLQSNREIRIQMQQEKVTDSKIEKE